MTESRPRVPDHLSDPEDTRWPGSGDSVKCRPAAFPFLAPPQRHDEIGRLGPYRVLRVLGQGSMGVVLEGEDSNLARPVALKVMLPELAARLDARERFFREARAAAAVQHDNIVTIHHVGDDEGVLYLVMPLLKGMSLEEYLRKGRPLSLAQVMRVAKDVARGLGAAHEKGLIHRDIKPANLWVDASAGGRLKILDFGLSRPIWPEQRLTGSGIVVGTPAYMAPEQMNGHPEARSDLYSLGVVLYRLLTGRLPFSHLEPLDLMVAAATQPPPHIREIAPNVPDQLADLVMRLLAKKPAGRPASAQALVDEIKSIGRMEGPAAEVPLLTEVGVEDSPTQSIRSPVPRRPRQRPTRGEWWHVAVLLGGMGLLLVAFALVLTRALPRRQIDGSKNRSTEKEKDRSVQVKPKDPPVVPGPQPGFQPMFNGKNLDGWERRGRDITLWDARDGALVFRGGDRGMLVTTNSYADFELNLEWRLPRQGRSGVILRQISPFPPKQARDGIEVRLVDEPNVAEIGPTDRCGAIFRHLAPLASKYLGTNRWNRLQVQCGGNRLIVTLNGTRVIDTNSQGAIEGMPARGAIGLHGLETGAEFRNLFIRQVR